MRKPAERFPLEPLAAAMGVRLIGSHDRSGNQFEPEFSVGCRELGERLGIPHRTVARWRVEGIPRFSFIRSLGRTVDTPDHLACHGAGLHPSLIWPNWGTTDDMEAA